MRGRGGVTPVCGEADRDHGKGGAELSAWRHSPLTISVTIVTPRMCHVFWWQLTVHSARSLKWRIVKNNWIVFSQISCNYFHQNEPDDKVPSIRHCLSKRHVQVSTCCPHIRCFKISIIIDHRRTMQTGTWSLFTILKIQFNMQYKS